MDIVLGTIHCTTY